MRGPPVPHSLRRIVILPEHLEQVNVGDRFGIEYDAYDFRVAGFLRADFPVERVSRVTVGVTDLRATERAAGG